MKTNNIQIKKMPYIISLLIFFSRVIISMMLTCCNPASAMELFSEASNSFLTAYICPDKVSLVHFRYLIPSWVLISANNNFHCPTCSICGVSTCWGNELGITGRYSATDLHHLLSKCAVVDLYLVHYFPGMLHKDLYHGAVQACPAVITWATYSDYGTHPCLFQNVHILHNTRPSWFMSQWLTQYIPRVKCSGYGWG